MQKDDRWKRLQGRDARQPERRGSKAEMDPVESGLLDADEGLKRR